MRLTILNMQFYSRDAVLTEANLPLLFLPASYMVSAKQRPCDILKAKQTLKPRTVPIF